MTYEVMKADINRAHLFLFGEGPRVVEDHNNGPFAVSPLQIARLIATVRAETDATRRNALLSIATMDVYTRKGERPPHEVMREIARKAVEAELDSGASILARVLTAGRAD